MSPAVVQHRHSGRAPPYSASGRCNASAPYRKRSPAAFSTATPSPPPPTGASSSSSSPIPPLVPLSWTKLQQIISWRNEVSAAHTTASSSSGHSIAAAETMEMEQEVFDYWDDGDDGIDRYTFVPEGGGERRLFDLPHPEMNPLMTSEQALIEQEYVRVIAQWNGYEEEKWKAEKIYRRGPTPENLAQFMKTANAVKVAGDAARYVELHATRWRVPTNFDALFCRHYRPPSFFLYLADPDDWNPPPWFYDDGLQQQPLSSPCMESFYSQHPIPPPFFPSHQPPISLQVPKWTIPTMHPMQLAV